MSALIRRLTIVAVVLLLSLKLVPGQAAPTQEQIARAIRELADDRFDTRERASKVLWEAGEAAKPALQQAAKSSDLEVSRRARNILEKFHYGVFPDTPPKVVALIERYQRSDPQAQANERPKIIEELIKEGRFGYRALKCLAEAQEKAEDRQTLCAQIAQETARLAPRLLLDGNRAGLESLFEIGLIGGDNTSVNNYTAYLLIHDRLAEAIARARTVPPKADNGNLSRLLRASGDLPGALEAAEKSGKTDIARALRYEMGDWNGLLEKHYPKDDTSIEDLGFRAAYQRLTGRKKEFEKTIAAISKLDGDMNSGKSYAGALLINDRPKEALELLTRHKRYQDAHEVLATQWQVGAALALLAQAKPEKSSERVAVECARGRFLHMLGERDEAGKVFSKLAAEMLTSTTPVEYAPLLTAEYELDLKKEAFAHGAALFARLAPELQSTSVLPHLFPRNTSAARLWWAALKHQHEREKPEQLLQRLRDLMDGKTTGKDLETLVAAVAKNGFRRPPPVNNRQDAPPSPGAQEAPEEAGERWQTLAETCATAGRKDLARKYWEKMLETDRAAVALRKLGDLLADELKWEHAADRYSQAWEKDPTDPVPLYLRGRALTKAGRAKEGRRLMDVAHELPLGNEAMRYQLAEALGQLGLEEEVKREQKLILRIADGDSWEGGYALRGLAMGPMAQTEPGKAADYLERFMFRCLRRGAGGFIGMRYYLLLPGWVHRLRAEGFLLAGKVDEAIAEARAGLAVLPLDVEVPIHLLPGLEKRRLKKEADELFDSVWNRWEELLRAYPRCGTGHNTLAWLGGRCRRNLDRSLAHAEKAVALEPGNPAYLDTLAEIHFQNGAKEKAVALLRKCATLEGDRVYYRKQLKRMEAGDPNAPVPEP